MKTLLLWCLLLLVAGPARAQKNFSEKQIDSLITHFTAQAKRYLVKSPSVWEYFAIDRRGVHMYPSSAHKRKDAPEFSVRWNQLHYFQKLIKYGDRNYQLEIYKALGGQDFDPTLQQTISILDQNHHIVPVSQNKPLTGIKIAIDPGHIAGDFQMAVNEERFIEIRNNQGKLYRFFEGELSLSTALVLRDSLRALGAEVFLTREKGNFSAMGMHFDEWVHTELVDTLLRQGMSLKHIDHKIGHTSKRKLYKEYFLDMDLDARAARINYFNPHFTIVIHFNADVENPGWSRPTHRNYSMIFVPGSYMAGEMPNKTARFDFLRTLLTDHMQESSMLSSFVMNEFETTLGVPAVDDYANKPFYLTNFSMKVQRGVYARNLRLCRLLNTPVCYGESQLQDNAQELEAFSKNDLANGYICPRVVQVAQSYLNGIKRYVETKKFRKR